jgi:hypothetical protein
MARLDEHDWAKLLTGKTKVQIAECELLRKLSDEIDEAREVFDEKVDAYKREIVRAVDYYSLSPEHAGLAAGRTTSRVNQILSELAK